jgi:hypothetical protein
MLGLACCLAVAGCGALGPAAGSLAQARGTSISFDSIDGPPPEIFNRFLTELDEEAAGHRIRVVPAGGEAAYRIRGYLAAHAKGTATSVAWVWDVYDADLHRAFRLGGEETAAAEARPLADEAMLRRIARAGLDQLADRMASPASPALEPALSSPRRGTAALSLNEVTAAAR